MQDARGGEGWGVDEAVAVWEQGVFLMLGPALVSLSKCPSWRKQFMVGGGGLMAVLPVLLGWGLFALSLRHWKHL